MKAILRQMKPTRSIGHRRYYELTEVVSKGESDMMGEVDIPKLVEDFIEKRVLPEYQEMARESAKGGIRFVCVSDAHDHIERLLFPVLKMWEDDQPFMMVSNNIGGIHTPLVTFDMGLDVYEQNDEDILKALAEKNGYEWEGIEGDKDLAFCPACGGSMSRVGKGWKCHCCSFSV